MTEYGMPDVSPEDYLGIKSSEERIYQPKEVELDDGKKFTLERRLTKVFPVEGTGSVISFVFVENTDKDKDNKGQFIYGAANLTDLGHSEIFATAVDTGIVPQVSEDPRGGGILKVKDGKFVLDRDSDQYKDVKDQDLLNGFIDAINNEYPMEAYDSKPIKKDYDDEIIDDDGYDVDDDDDDDFWDDNF